MTSVYQEKIYPEIPPSAPPPPDEYRLQKISEAETFLHSKVSARDKLAKRFKLCSNIAAFSDTIVVGSITALEVASVVTLATGVGLPVGLTLAATGLF